MKISRSMLGLMALVLLSLVTTDVMAQRGGGDDGGGRGRGGQDRGGQDGGRRGGGGGSFRGGGSSFGGQRSGGSSVAGLLRIDEVRAEIDLMPDQEEALKKMSENRERTERPEWPGRDASEEERKVFMEKIQALAKEAAAKQREQLEEVLLPEQIERLDEISLQQKGVSALLDSEVAKKLEMSETQSEDAKKISQESREEMTTKMRKMFQDARDGGGGFDRDKMREEFTAMTKAVNEKILNVLTEDQKKKFEEMKGEKFEMPERDRSSRGGGDRGGAGGRGGGDRGGAGGRGGGDRGGRGGGERGGGDRERQRPAAE